MRHGVLIIHASYFNYACNVLGMLIHGTDNYIAIPTKNNQDIFNKNMTQPVPGHKITANVACNIRSLIKAVFILELCSY